MWNDLKFRAFDFETSGVLPEYALQPHRVATGQSWVTCLGVAAKGVVTGILAPTKEQIKEVLDSAIRDKVTLIGWNVAFDIAWCCAYGLTAEVMKVQWLDGMLLWRHLEVEPEYEITTKAKKRSFGLKAAVAEMFPQHAGYEADVDFHDESPEARAKLLYYCKQDVIFTLAIVKKLYLRLAETPRRLASALIEAQALPLVAQAWVEGMVVDTQAVDQLSIDLIATAAKCLEELSPHGVTEAVVRSPKQLATLMFDTWGLKPLKETGTGARSTDKETLYELAFEDPRAKTLKDYREALGNLTKFAENLTESVTYNGDGRTRPQAAIFGTYCVPGTTEVLTPTGWVPIAAWRGGRIMQVHPDLSMEFLPAGRHAAGVTTEWVHLKQRAFDGLFTPDHTVVYLKQKTLKWGITKAKSLATGHGEAKYIPVAGMAYLEGEFSENQMRLFAAVQADGYFSSRGLRFTFKKQRKISRIKDLLQTLGLVYREYVCSSYPDRTEITVVKSLLPGWCQKDKKVFGAWLLNTDAAGVAAFVSEIVHWDGSHHPDGGVKYTSTIKGNVEWVVTMASLCGRKASIHAASQQYSCHISDSPTKAYKTILPHRDVTTETLELEAFCPVTKTGFWLARSNGHIYVTGNSGRMTYYSKQGKNKDERPTGFALHQMKRGKDYRNGIKAPDGYTICEFDAAGQEFRWMAIASGDETMLRLCMPGEDPHGFMGARIAHRDYRELVAAVHAEDKEAKAQRQLGKVGNLALQFRTSALKLCSVARVQYGLPMDLAEATMIRSTYLKSYPGVPKYWDEQIADCRANKYVETFAGRRVALLDNFNGKYGWSLESTAINYRIQGTGADQKYLALAVLRPYMVKHGIRFAWELHDGIYLYVPDGKVAQCVPEIQKMLSNLPYARAWGFTPPIPLPWDAKTGKRWGDLKEYIDANA